MSTINQLNNISYISTIELEMCDCSGVCVSVCVFNAVKMFNSDSPKYKRKWEKKTMYMPITVMLKWYERPWWLYFISVFNFQFLFSLSFSLPFRPLFSHCVSLAAATAVCATFILLWCRQCRFMSWGLLIHSHITQALDDYEIEEDLPNAMKLLGEMNNNVKQVSDLVESMLQRVKSGELTTEYGLSFLEVRYHMLLTYLINLTYVVLRKCSGTSFNISNRLE